MTSDARLNKQEEEIMILNTGSRTDIPGYYSEWFYNRIREGFCMVRNPYYPEQVLRYELTPELIDCMVFCTKNPEPMLERIHELDAFRQFWFVTITPYGREIEPFVPDKKKVMESFCRLSEHVGVRGMGWRYDPIFISDKYSFEFHCRAFEEMAAVLAGYVDQVTVSFVDLYVKTKKNFPEVREVTRSEQEALAKIFVSVGKKYGMQIRSCHEGEFLQAYGVNTEGCMSQRVIERAVGGKLNVPKRPGARDGCSCLLGADIGAYNTCGHGCRYCYANYDQRTVEQNRRAHDPESPFLVGGAQPGDVVRNAVQKSWYDGQMMFELD